jgi:serine/threonine protein kinase/tetratricopeptide (TPR) repeat protein
MTPERWQQINKLLQQVVDVSRDEQSARLAELCPDDPDLRGEVEALISFQEQAQTFMELPAVEENLYLLCGDQADSMVGRTLGGRYTIEAQLGVGGMGEVYLAGDTKLDQKVAIKFLSSFLQPSVKAKERLVLEAKALAQLDHPNICRLIDLKEEGNLSFIVMQYVGGETLADRLKNKPLSLHEILNVSIQVLEALSEAHSIGIVHRDIKPRNIMINPRGQVKVLDFGLVKLVGSAGSDEDFGRGEGMLSRTGEFAGTPPYMSPEQTAGAPVDGRSDLFAVGVILYECVSGTRPFSGETDEKVMKRVRQFHPAPPSLLNPRIPPDLDIVILRALAKRRDERYQSANEFLTDLRAIQAKFQADDDLQTRPLPSGDELQTRSRLITLTRTLRQPFVSIPTVCVVVVIGWFLFKWIPGRPSPLSQEAVYWYDQGALALRERSYHKASKALEQAIEKDQRFALAHARLAEAYAELDYADKAKDEIIRAESAADEFSLNESDQIYMRAVTRTVLRDFGPAIDTYKQLLQNSADSDKAHVYLDLGRAYEKNDQLREAREEYLEAVKLAPQEAAASLRLGIICGQQQDFACANDAFQKAETIYTAQGNFEGVTEVYFERGFLFLNIEDTKKARPYLESALQRSKASDNINLQIRSLQALSSVSAIDGETALAEQRATEALALARTNGIENQFTAGLIWLGNNFFVANNFNEAEKFYQRALDLAQRDKLRLHEAWARLQLGSLFLSQRKTQEALQYLDQALPFYQRGNYRRWLSSASLLRGRALRNTGEFDAAHKAFDDVLQLSEQLGDRVQLATSHEELGSLLMVQERYPEALSHFDEAYKIYHSMNLTIYAAYGAMHRANALWQVGRYGEARTALGEVLSIAQTSNKKLLLASAQMTEAFMQLSEQHTQQARANARKAQDLAGKDFGLTATQARYVLGLIQVRSGASGSARQLCQEAVDMALKTNDKYLLSVAQLTQAEVMLDSNRPQEALQIALQTRPSFELLGQKVSEWRAWLIAARASQRLGKKMFMHDFAVNADKSLKSLQDRWGREAYNGYLSRQDIQRSLKELELLINP